MLLALAGLLPPESAFRLALDPWLNPVQEEWINALLIGFVGMLLIVSASIVASSVAKETNKNRGAWISAWNHTLQGIPDLFLAYMMRATYSLGMFAGLLVFIALLDLVLFGVYILVLTVIFTASGTTSNIQIDGVKHASGVFLALMGLSGLKAVPNLNHILTRFLQAVCLVWGGVSRAYAKLNKNQKAEAVSKYGRLITHIRFFTALDILLALSGGFILVAAITGFQQTLARDLSLVLVSIPFYQGLSAGVIWLVGIFQTALLSAYGRPDWPENRIDDKTISASFDLIALDIVLLSVSLVFIALSGMLGLSLRVIGLLSIGTFLLLSRTASIMGAPALGLENQNSLNNTHSNLGGTRAFKSEAKFKKRKN